MTARSVGAALASTLAVLVLAGAALACGGDPVPENLVAPQKVKAALHAAFTARHPGALVTGPVRGRTYYGMVGGDWYAVSLFRVAGRTTKPVILVRHGNRPDRWHVVRETRGAVCGRFVPVSLIGVWHLRQVPHTDCFVEPVA